MSSLTLTPGSTTIDEDAKTAFDMLGAAMQQPGGVCLINVSTDEGKHSHTVIALVVKDGHAIPVAIIPTGVTVSQFLKNYDAMSATFGGAQHDPEFKGILQ